MAVRHAFTDPKADGADATIVRPSDWNADHTGTPINLFIGPDPIIASTSVVNPGGANAGNFISFQVFVAVTVTKAYVRITSGGGSGNIDLGIYSSNGTTLTRIASTGSTACPAASNNASLTFTASVTLTPGTLYYSAAASDNVIAALNGTAFTPPFSGTVSTWVATVPTSFPLPATVSVSSFVNTKAWGCLFL